MTRINVGVYPNLLSREHLIAEHREIKRIPNIIHKANLKNIPENFCLGTGHVKFFYNKGLYTLNRYKQLYEECIRRNFNVQDYSGAWDNYPKELMNDWCPSEVDRKLIEQRIQERTKTKLF